MINTLKLPFDVVIHTRERSDEAPGQSELLLSPRVRWQSDPTRSQTGSGQESYRFPLESPGATEDDGLVWLKEDAQQRFLSGHWGVEGLGGWGGGKLGKLGKWTEAIIHF